MRGGDEAQVRAIGAEDVPAVAAFLHAELNPRVSRAAWAYAMTPPWSHDWPDHGLMLVDGGRVVGAQLAFYSRRELDGKTELFCNLGAWCVLEEHRASGVRLLRGLLRRREYTFTDLSPSGNVVGLNRRLRFTDLDTRVHAVPATPGLAPGVRITSDPSHVAELVRDDSRRIFEDHRSSAAAHHVVVSADGQDCYLMFRRDRRKRLPLFATVLYVDRADVFRRHAPAVARHVLLHHHAPVLLAEEHVVGGRPTGGVAMRSARPRMFRSDRVAPKDVDYLYSELTCVAW